MIKNKNFPRTLFQYTPLSALKENPEVQEMLKRVTENYNNNINRFMFKRKGNQDEYYENNDNNQEQHGG